MMTPEDEVPPSAIKSVARIAIGIVPVTGCIVTLMVTSVLPVPFDSVKKIAPLYILSAIPLAGCMAVVTVTMPFFKMVDRGIKDLKKIYKK